MFVTITSTAAPATDLGFLLHKHPGRAQTFDVAVGTAHVFYPEADEDRCTAALLLEVDPIGARRGRGPADGRRSRWRSTSTTGRTPRPRCWPSRWARSSAPRWRAAATHGPSWPTVRCRWIHVPGAAVPRRRGEVVERLFAPLGWTVEADAGAAGPDVPGVGRLRYVDLRLTGDLRLADALNHLYVLLPVLDDAKHYWVSTDEVDKLLRAGAGWLPTHPERDLITRRYLGAPARPRRRRAVGRLAEVDDTEPEALDNAVAAEDAGDARRPARAAGRAAPQARCSPRCATRGADARRRPRLRRRRAAPALLADPAFTEVVGVDVSHRALEIASAAAAPRPDAATGSGRGITPAPVVG